jgi:N-acetyl-gamma-glutamyl-phosphate reductase
MTGHSPNPNGTGHKHRVFVAGALGAVGSLVADLLNSHAEIELGAITARATGDENSPIGKKLYEIYPEHRVDLPLQELEDVDVAGFDAAVVAYPAGAASQLARRLRDSDLTVIDSCADFRFADLGTYEASYGPHAEPSLLSEAVYGLPELHREQLRGARLIGNPGCYPTASLLALAPLARKGLIRDVVIDAKSGVSGAGKRGESAPPFVGTFDNMRPYGVPGHRHEPEIEEQLSFLGYGGTLSFVPHLVPLDQGELVSCYVTPSRRVEQAELNELYEEAYGLEPFVELTSGLPDARSVQRTNLCCLHPIVDHDGSRVFVFATIDNLWKGGASQAVQNLNLALGLPEFAGISHSLSMGKRRPEDASALDRFSVSA